MLFGFIHKQERVLFRELIKVNGVGLKLELAILSPGCRRSNLSAPWSAREINVLVKLLGVGKKTAERLVVKMKDRFKGLSGDLFTPQGVGDITPAIDTPVNPADPGAKRLPRWWCWGINSRRQARW